MKLRFSRLPAAVQRFPMIRRITCACCRAGKAPGNRRVVCPARSSSCRRRQDRTAARSGIDYGLGGVRLRRGAVRRSRRVGCSAAGPRRSRGIRRAGWRCSTGAARAVLRRAVLVDAPQLCVTLLGQPAAAFDASRASVRTHATLARASLPHRPPRCRSWFSRQATPDVASAHAALLERSASTASVVLSVTIPTNRPAPHSAGGRPRRLSWTRSGRLRQDLRDPRRAGHRSREDRPPCRPPTGREANTAG